MGVTRRTKRKADQVVLKGYENIKVESRKMIKLLKVDRLPMVTLEEIVNRGKLKDKFPDATLEDFRNKFNASLDKFLEVAQMNSNNVGDGAISMFEIETLMDAMKEGFAEGQSS